MFLLGAMFGLGLGLASEKLIGPLLYQVRPTEFTLLTAPVVTIAAAAVFASLAPVIRAIRIDPVTLIRVE